MGCFLACFGSDDGRRRRRKQKNKSPPRDGSPRKYKSAQPDSPLVKETAPETVVCVCPLPEVSDKPADLTLNGRKKVTFDLNVKTYEDASARELPTDLSEGKEVKKGEEEGQKDEQERQVLSTSDNSPTKSSTGSFPANHRYQDSVCSEDEIDDEDEELQYADCDLDDEDEDDGQSDKEEQEEESYESCFSLPLERGPRITDSPSPEKGEVCESRPISGLSNDQKSTGFTSRNARDRSHYVNSVLNPVENLTQWKAVKARSGPSKQRRKENIFDMEQELHPPFSEEPTFKLLKERKENINLEKEMHTPSSTEQSFKLPNLQMDSTPRNAGLGSPPRQEISVDASLSNWLVSSASTPSVKNNLASTESTEYSQSLSSHSSRIYDDRPILGALTVEELRQHSLSSSPRRSPSRSPDDVPIVGSVGSYWNSSSSPQSVSGPKGIPNTTSKYREDKRVNWHNTPFEVRLERALVESAVEVYASHRRPRVL